MDDDVERALRAGPAPPADAARAAAGLPGRAAGAGLLDVAYAELDSPLGVLVAAATPRGLVALAYAEGGPADPLERLAREVSPRILRDPARLDPVRRELDEYFAGRRRAFGVRVDWSGVRGFARRVLARAAEIPYGATLTYAEVAAAAGSPRGARAAGNALGANRIPIVIPCHRVLPASGRLGGYTGGVDRKETLLRLERGGG